MIDWTQIPTAVCFAALMFFMYSKEMYVKNNIVYDCTPSPQTSRYLKSLGYSDRNKNALPEHIRIEMVETLTGEEINDIHRALQYAMMYKLMVSKEDGLKYSNQRSPEWHFISFRRLARNILETYFYYSCYHGQRNHINV